MTDFLYTWPPLFTPIYMAPALFDGTRAPYNRTVI